MNAARNLIVDFRINGKHDHYINRPEDKHVQPSFVIHGDKDGRVTKKGTKKKRKYS